MDKYLRPSRFDTDPSTASADKEWKHWHATFENFIDSIDNPDKRKLLINCVAPSIYEYIVDCSNTYESSIQILQDIYVRPSNVVYTCHLLATRKQDTGETFDVYVQSLKKLSKACDFAAVNAEENKNDHIRDAFINGILLRHIQQRLLENRTLTQAIDQARTLESAHKNSDAYESKLNVASVSNKEDDETVYEENDNMAAATNISQGKCYNCGNCRHPCYKCPAKNAVCINSLCESLPFIKTKTW